MLTKKGREIFSKMQSEYSSKKGESVFYASRNSGRIKGVEKGYHKRKKDLASKSK